MNDSLKNLYEMVSRNLSHLPPIDMLTVSEAADGRQGEDHEIRSILNETCRSASSAERQRVESEYLGFGPLATLLDDTEITEIIVNGSNSIWFEKNGQLHQLEDQFYSSLTYRNFIGRLSREAQIQASLDCPFADGVWCNHRVHLVIPPASHGDAVLTLRRHPTNPWTLSQLREQGWARDDALRVLEKMISERWNFLVIGGTGSGKTSVLNACLQKLQSRERAILIEDTSELRSPNSVSCKLLTRKDIHGHLREIDQSELLRQALRMRPDRIVMGEIRGTEAKDLLMAFASGHAGCMGTLHAESARQALIRLEMLIQLGAAQWSLHAVRTLIMLSLKAVVVVSRQADGARRLDGIYRITSLEDFGLLIEKVI